MASAPGPSPHVDDTRRPTAVDDIIDRHEEVAWIGRLVVGLVADGTGGTAVIEGPAGIGKSRLIGVARNRALTDRVTVLTARGAEIEHDLAFGGVRQLLAEHVERLSTDDRARVLAGSAASALAVLSPDASRVQQPVDPFFGLTRLVGNLAERGPLLLLVDDVHWLDEASARFLAYLARRIEGEPVLLLAGLRAGSEATSDAIADIVDLAEVRRPRPLTGDGIARLLGFVLDSPVSDELAAACRRVTGGVPFLVEEVGRALRDVPPRSRPAAVDRIAPDGVGRAVLDRIRRLPEPARVLAEAVALFPAGTPLMDAAAVAGLEPAVAAVAGDALVGAAVFGPGPELAFLHPVMRSAEYEQLGVFRRRQAHARAADVLIARDADVEDIAAHLLAAEPSGDERHATVLEAAAQRAERAGALAAAARYLDRALDDAREPRRRTAIRARLGQLLLETGSPRVEDVLRAALADATSSDERLDRAFELARANVTMSHGDDAVDALLGVMADAEAADPERQHLFDGLLAQAAWESSRYAELYTTVADELPRDLPGATVGERLVLTQVASRMLDRCEPHDRVADVARRAAGSGGAGSALETADVLHLLISCGALDEAEALCDRWQDDARSSGRDALYLDAQVGHARIAWIRGDIRRCEAVAQLGLELPDVPPVIRSVFACWLASVCVVAGDHAAATALLDSAHVEGMTFGAKMAIATRRGMLALARNRPEEAVSILEPLRAGLQDRGSGNPTESTWLIDLGEAMVAAGRRDEGLGLIASLRDAAERFGEPRPVGLIHLALGRAIGTAAGLDHLVRAAETLGPSSYRHDAARADVELGAALRRANRRAESRPYLRRALDFGQGQRLAPLIARAEDELKASGARPRRRALSGIEALTPSEQRIGRLAAAGMTNREIATHLFLTVKTVEMHLARAFDKLGVRSRKELPADLGGAEPA